MIVNQVVYKNWWKDFEYFTHDVALVFVLANLWCDIREDSV